MLSEFWPSKCRRTDLVRLDSNASLVAYIFNNICAIQQLLQEGLAMASIVRDDPSALPGNDPFPRACMHRDRNAW